MRSAAAACRRNLLFPVGWLSHWRVPVLLPSLDDPHSVPEAAVASVRENGHCVIRGLAGREEVEAFRPAIEAAVQRHAENQAPLGERSTYGKAFLQVPNNWMTDET